VEMALWFHDAVYDPHAADNEAQSATWAIQALTKAQIPFTVAQNIATRVLATKHQQVPQCQDAQLLTDIDLTILGSTPIVFAEYDRQIRLEYQWVAEDEYRKRRIQVLTSLLARSTIYQTPYFYTRYEQQARQSLVRAIDRLTHP
jgi:predicted metal-dependent HD superfamily phosphohydrolase